jgi:hypothetical protein
MVHAYRFSIDTSKFGSKTCLYYLNCVPSRINVNAQSILRINRYTAGYKNLHGELMMPISLQKFESVSLDNVSRSKYPMKTLY